MKKRLDDVRKSKSKLEEDLATVRETVHRAAVKLSPHPRQKGMAGSPSGSVRHGTTESSSLMQDLTGVMERLHHLENERKVC
jgi:predicted  nucleic acid-binding Zn-ribbon protein